MDTEIILCLLSIALFFTSLCVMWKSKAENIDLLKQRNELEIENRSLLARNDFLISELNCYRKLHGHITTQPYKQYTITDRAA